MIKQVLISTTSRIIVYIVLNILSSKKSIDVDCVIRVGF